MATPTKQHVKLLKPYGDHKKGEVIELVPAAAKRFVNTGYAKAVDAPPRNKSMNSRAVPNKASHEDHAGQAAAAS